MRECISKKERIGMKGKTKKAKEGVGKKNSSERRKGNHAKERIRGKKGVKKEGMDLNKGRKGRE
jgi:hypothetical protein